MFYQKILLISLNSSKIISFNFYLPYSYWNENINECLVSIWLLYVNLLRDEEIDIKNFSALSLYKILHSNIKLNDVNIHYHNRG